MLLFILSIICFLFSIGDMLYRDSKGDKRYLGGDAIAMAISFVYIIAYLSSK